MRGVPLELLLQVGAHERRAPAKLDDVHALPRDLEQVVDLGDRQPAVDHVREAAYARLGGALGNVEEVGYRMVAGVG